MHSYAKVFLTLLVSTLFLCGTESRAKADEIILDLVDVNQKGSLASLTIRQSGQPVTLPLPGSGVDVFGFRTGRKSFGPGSRLALNSSSLRRLSETLTSSLANFSMSEGRVRERMLPEVVSDLYAGTSLLVTTEPSLIGQVARFGFSALTLNPPSETFNVKNSPYRPSFFNGVKATVLAVPEKATMLVLGLGMALAGAIVRRRRVR